MIWQVIRYDQNCVVCLLLATIPQSLFTVWISLGGDESHSVPTKGQENDSTKSSFVNQWA